MRTQQEREQQTVLIGTAIGVFAVIMVAEVLGLWLVHRAFDVPFGDVMLGCAVVVAGALAVVNLVRSERH